MTTLNDDVIVHASASARRFVVIDENGDVVEDLTEHVADLEARVAALEAPGE